MDRLACVDVPALPLQLLLRGQPDWSEWPVAVVDEDKPLGIVLWANEKARHAGILSGMKYAQGLSLVPTLRAGTIADAAIQEGLRAIMERLHGFSPKVEPSSNDPGIFWLDAGGLEGLFPSLEVWAQALRQDLAESGFVAAVVVGFRRFGTYAAAKLLRGRKAAVFATPEREDQICRSAPLRLVMLDPRVRDSLEKLGVHTVGDFLHLPAQGILRRFGPEIHDLHRFASGDLDVPLNPTPHEPPPEAHLEIGYREDNAERLVFVIKPLVDQILSGLGHKGLALVELQIRLLLDDSPDWLALIRTAAPTLSSVTVMELVQLRLNATPLPSPALEVTVTATMAEPATDEQLSLFADTSRRDPAAALRAFARLRAAFGGQDVVVKAALRDRHSPEASFAWEPLHHLAPPLPDRTPTGTLVRRILDKPEPLPFPPASGLEGWQLRSGTVGRSNGPYRLTGGWWRAEIQRDYYFVETNHGELLWVYYDRVRQRWFLQGEIS